MKSAHHRAVSKPCTKADAGRKCSKHSVEYCVHWCSYAVMSIQLLSYDISPYMNTHRRSLACSFVAYALTPVCYMEAFQLYFHTDPSVQVVRYRPTRLRALAARRLKRKTK